MKKAIRDINLPKMRPKVTKRFIFNRMSKKSRTIICNKHFCTVLQYIAQCNYKKVFNMVINFLPDYLNGLSTTILCDLGAQCLSGFGVPLHAVK